MQAYVNSAVLSIGDVIQIFAVAVSILGLIIANRVNRNKLSVYQCINPVLSSTYQKHSPHSPTLEIRYDNQLLSDPHLLELDIVYTGKEALIDPCIRVSCIERIALHGGMVVNTPQGYENLWTIQKIDSYTYDIKLKHINPKQALKACFIIESAPTTAINVSCTMPNLEVHGSGYINNNIKPNTLFLTKSNIWLLCITGLLGLTAQYWSRSVEIFAWLIGGYIPAGYSISFVLSSFILAILLNAFSIPSINAGWVSSQRKRHVAIACLALVCIASFYPLALEFDTDFLIVAQIVAGSIIAVLVAILIRLVIIEIESNK